MFAKSIVLSDAFLDMPMSSRCLYFTLSMLADDDGFVGSPKAIMRQCGATQDDLAILLSKRYVLGFDSGVIVIKHWRINNYLRNDRYRKTTYLEELETLALDSKDAYTEKLGIPVYNQVTENGIPSIGKDSIGKVSIVERESSESPSLEEIEDFCKERKSNVNPKRFYDFYSASGWKDKNGNPINWKQKLIAWEGTERSTINTEEKSDPQKFNTDDVLRFYESMKGE